MVNNNTDKEIWKDIKGYEGCYQVSNTGKVRSLDKVDRRGNECYGVIKKPQDNGHGYKYVQLKLDGTYKNHYIHRLVATYFIDNPNSYEQVNHMNEIKEDNDVNNLEWCTHEYNNSYGTKPVKNRIHLSKLHKASETPLYSVSREGVRRFHKSQKNAGVELGINTVGINNMLKGRQKTHKGYTFEYARESEE